MYVNNGKNSFYSVSLHYSAIKYANELYNVLPMYN